MKGSKALLIILATMAGLIALVFVLRASYARLAAEHWRSRLPTVADDRAAVMLQHVAELGDPGISVLVEALGSERESVARAAKRSLLGQLDRWRLLRGRVASTKLAILADTLAERVEEFGPTARSNAADLAAQILAWPLNAQAVDRSRVIASCEKVLRATNANRQRLAQKPRSAGIVSRTAPLQACPSTVDPPRQGFTQPFPETASGPSVAELSRLPGGGLPVDSFPASKASFRWSGQSRVADVRLQQPLGLVAPSAAEPVETSPARPGDPPAENPPDAAPRPTDHFPSQDVSQSALLRPMALAAANACGQSQSDGLGAVKTVDLMRWLRAADKSTAARARDELTRRGFNEVHLDLARRLFDPDPEIRKQLVRRLPELRVVDAVPWLLWLSRDPDCEVRLLAITLMATTGDAALLRQVQETARRDPDPRVRRRAELIAAQRDGSTR